MAIAQLGAWPGQGPQPFHLAIVGGVAVAVIVAAAAGGRGAVLGLIGYELTLVGLALGGAAAAQRHWLGPSADIFDPASVVIGFWPNALGLAIGLLFSRLASSRAGSTNAPLEAAGVFPLAIVPLGVYGTGILLFVGPAGPLVITSVQVALSLLRPIFAGVLIRVRSRRPIREALILASVFLLTWIYPHGWRVLELPREVVIAQPLIFLPLVEFAVLLAAVAFPVRRLRSLA